MKLGIIILAAGKGSRMKSQLPKVLHPLAGQPLLGHVLDTARGLKPERIVIVYGHGGDAVQSAFSQDDLIWAEQAEQLGTGHAVMQGMAGVEGLDKVLVLYGDVPLISQVTLQRLVDETESPLGLLTVLLDNPMGYGRIVRDDAGNVQRIVEQKDANEDELKIQEINTGIMLIGVEKLKNWLGQLSNQNAQGEYYLTDIIEMAVHDGLAVHIAHPNDALEAEGVNNRVQLAELERAYQKARAFELMTAGVGLVDPARFDLRGSLKHGQDVLIDVNVIIEGEVEMGHNVKIGANTVIRNSKIGDNVTILENCVIEAANVGADSRIGPFSRLRPGADLQGAAHVGNFVEIKKAQIGLGSKVNHLTYIGDAKIGAGVNVGAGTITCNYDGANKHLTVIDDNAFIGSNTALVAPVTVGSGATIGAGSVINKDAPDDKLTLARAKQVTIDGWQRPQKQAKK